MKKMQKPDAKISRTGKKVISGYFEPGFHKTFKLCATNLGITQQQLLEHAINLVFYSVEMKLKNK